MDEANRELQELAQEALDAQIEQAYGEWIDTMLHQFYEECFESSEWDL